MGKTSIDYVTFAFNPWQGCAKISAECRNCYAEVLDKRFHGGIHWGKDAPRRWQSGAYWDEPLTWQKRAEKAARIDRVLCGTMCDILEPRASLHRWRHELAQLILRTPNLLWMLLSKRPEKQHLLDSRLKTAPNVILGTTAGTQKTADERIPALIEWPGAVWVSVEPLLEAVSLSPWLPWLSFVVAGCESGPGRRPMDLDWARTLRDECAAHKIPYFLKQAEIGTGVVHCPPLDGLQAFGDTMTNDELREKAALAISANLDIEETERADSFALEALALDVHRIANVLDELRDGVRSIGPLLRMVPGAGQLFGAGLDIGVDLKGKENKIEEVQPAPPDWVDDALKDG